MIRVIDELGYEIEQLMKTNQNYTGYCIYGSFAEQVLYLPANPNDIDLIIITDEKEPVQNISTKFNCTNLDVNIEFMTHNELMAFSSEPKFFISYSDLNTDLDLYEVHVQQRTNGVIRNSVSSVSSKAFNKGKKKLTVADDYDVQLGLKNLYHAVKLPIITNWYFNKVKANSFVSREFDVIFLTNYYNSIHRIYNNSTGTLEERCNEVLGYAKPIYNSVMTEFRKRFPKVE